MKRTSFFYFSLAAIAIGSMASCQDYDPLDENTLQKLTAQQEFQATLDEYTKNFETRYGGIDINNDWGFSVPTPGKTRGEVINKNEWISRYHLQVPGLPDVYYKKGSENPVTGQYHYLDDTYSSTYDDAKEPGGDVTDEEIQYVSTWFRTHRYPTSIPLHCSDFYIQDISSDNDRDANGYKDNSLSVFEYDETNQQWVKKITYVDATFDQLAVKTTDNSTTDANGFVHTEKFNGSRQNKLHDVETVSMDMNNPFESTLNSVTNNRTIDYFTCARTEDFQVHCSVDDKNRNNYKFDNAEEATPIWVLVHLHFIGQAPEYRIYDGYYLGFDYAAYKMQADGKKYEIHEPDGYYSNWIVKITPGVPDPTHYDYTRRIMCEDLGNTLDLDFDDVVFDATLNWQSDWYYTPDTEVDVTINLRAAGGTMPIWVGKNPNNNVNAADEIHYLLGKNPSTTPINVAYPTSAPVTASVANYHTKIKSLDFDDIDIWVYNTVKKEFIKLPKSKYLNNYEHDPDHNESDGDLWYVYNKNKDARHAPQKFAVPTSVLWMQETKQIETGYPKFGEWAHDHAKYPVGNSGAWYLADVNSGVICGEVGENPDIHMPTPGVSSNTGQPGTTSTYLNMLTWDVTPFTNNSDWGTAAVINGTQSGGNSKMFNHGEKAILMATPKGDAQFLGWKDNQDGAFLSTDAQFEITVNKHENIIAMFKGTKVTPKYHIYVSSENTSMGTVVDKSGEYEANAELVLSATPAENYEFVGWYIDGNLFNTNNPAYYYASYDNCHIVAKFKEKTND